MCFGAVIFFQGLLECKGSWRFCKKAGSSQINS